MQDKHQAKLEQIVAQSDFDLDEQDVDEESSSDMSREDQFHRLERRFKRRA
jgi:hypothetical protein